MLPPMRAEKPVKESSGYWVFAGGAAGIFPAESASFFGACCFGTCSAGGCARIRAATLQINRMTLINRTISFSPTEARLDDALNTTKKKPRRKSTWLLRKTRKQFRVNYFW